MVVVGAGVGRLCTPHLVRSEATMDASWSVVRPALLQTATSATATAQSGHTSSGVLLGMGVNVATPVPTATVSMYTVRVLVATLFVTVKRRH